MDAKLDVMNLVLCFLLVVRTNGNSLAEDKRIDFLICEVYLANWKFTLAFVSASCLSLR